MFSMKKKIDHFLKLIDKKKINQKKVQIFYFLLYWKGILKVMKKY